MMIRDNYLHIRTASAEVQKEHINLAGTPSEGMQRLNPIANGTKLLQTRQQIAKLLQTLPFQNVMDLNGSDGQI